MSPWQRMKQHLELKAENIESALGCGLAPSYDEYRFICGRLFAMREMGNFIEEARRKDEYSDDED